MIFTIATHTVTLIVGFVMGVLFVTGNDGSTL